MYINPEKITKIAIRTLENPVDWEQFKRFLQKSPFIRQVAFVGKGIFKMRQFVQMVAYCNDNNIILIFGECGNTTAENIDALVEYGNVICVNIYENDTHVNRLLALKTKYNTDIPEVNLIVDVPKRTPQDKIPMDSYAFYSHGTNTHNIACLQMLKEPMIDYNGDLLGCWENLDSKHPINAFDLGMEQALNHRSYKNIMKMLRTGKICMSCPCARCLIFQGLVWSGNTVDVYKKTIA
jgi:hypothetical protein